MTNSTPCSYVTRTPRNRSRTVARGAPATFTVRYRGWTSVLSGAIAKSPLISGCRHTVIRSMSPGRSTGSRTTPACAAADAEGAMSSAATTQLAPRRSRRSPFFSHDIPDRLAANGPNRSQGPCWHACASAAVAVSPRTVAVAGPRWRHGICRRDQKRRRSAGVLDALSKAAFACLWCFVFVLPWDVYAELPVVGSIPRLVGLVASTVGVLYIGARRRVRPLSWFHVFTVVFVLWAAVSTLWSIDTEATRTRLMTYLQLTVLVWLIWEIAWSPQRTRALLGAYVLGVAVAAVATIRDYLSDVHAAGYAGRFNALSVNPNELGLTLAIGLPMAWYLTLSQPQRRVARLWQLYLPLSIAAILLTASRGAFLTMLVALAIIPATRERLRLRTKAALCALAVASLALATSVVPEATLERLQTTRADIESGYFGNRAFIWRAGLEVAREHPLAGPGAGTFGAAVEPTLGFQWSSHSVPLGIVVEDGLVGLLLFLAIIGAAFTALRRAPRLPRRVGVVLLLAPRVGELSP